MTRGDFAIAVTALVSALLVAACGRYGPPVRSAPVTPTPAAAASPDPPGADPAVDPATPAVPEPDFKIKLPETLDAPDDEDDPE